MNLWQEVFVLVFVLGVSSAAVHTALIFYF